MKKLSLKLLSITIIIASLLVVSCNETDEMVPEITTINEVNSIEKQAVVAKFELPESYKADYARWEAMSNTQNKNVQAKITAENTIVVPRDYETINEAVQAAYPGDVIKVRAGTYNEEEIFIDKNNISLIAAEGVYLNGGISIFRTNNVKIQGFNIKSTYWYGINSFESEGLIISRNKIEDGFDNASVNGPDFGIFLDNSINNDVKYNSCTKFTIGIYSNINNYGPSKSAPYYSETNNTIKRNNTFKNKVGIYSKNPVGDRLIANQCIGNENYGIILDLSISSIIKNNIAYFNGDCGIFSVGAYPNSFISNYTDCKSTDNMLVPQFPQF